MEYLFESPCWDPARGCVWYANVYRGELWQFKDGLTLLKHRFDGLLSSINLCLSGNLLITTKNKIIIFNPETYLLSTLYEFKFDHPNDRLNDCKVSDCGSLVYTYFCDIRPRNLRGSVGVFSKKRGAIEIFKDKFMIPNGVVTDSGAEIFWISDTVQSKIFQFPYTVIAEPYSDCGLIPKRVIDIPKEYGRPDGSTLDSSGNYWVALLDFGMVGTWAADGRFLGLTSLVTKHPTMVTFWGESLNLGLVTKKVLVADDDECMGVESFTPIAIGRLVNFFEDIQ